MYLLCVWIVCLCLLPIFSIKLFISFSLQLLSSLYVRTLTFLSVIYTANTFTQFVFCFFLCLQCVMQTYCFCFNLANIINLFYYCFWIATKPSLHLRYTEIHLISFQHLSGVVSMHFYLWSVWSLFLIKLLEFCLCQVLMKLY